MISKSLQKPRRRRSGTVTHGNVVLEARDLAAGYNGQPIIQGVNLQLRGGEIVALLGANGAGKTMTILDNLRVADEGRKGALSYLTDLFWPRRSPLSGTAVEAIRDFNLEQDLMRQPKDISFGRRRLVGIARAIATGASVVLLDEPAAGLNDHEAAEFGQLVRLLASKWNIGVLIIEHNVELIMDICDDVYVLSFGRVISHGPTSRVRTDPQVVEAYLGS